MQAHSGTTAKAIVASDVGWGGKLGLSRGSGDQLFRG